MKIQKILIIFSVLLLTFISVGCKENLQNKTENIADTEFSESMPENTSEKNPEISSKTKQKVSETEFTSESISDIVTAETTQNSDDVIIIEEIPEDTLQSDMPVIRYDNYEQFSPVTTAESAEEVTTTQSVIELPFVPVG